MLQNLRIFKEGDIDFGFLCLTITGKKLSNNDFVRMFETIRSISTSAELGCGVDDTVSRNYEQGILVRGMIVLREDIKEKPGHQFLYKVIYIFFLYVVMSYSLHS